MSSNNAHMNSDRKKKVLAKFLHSTQLSHQTHDREWLQAFYKNNLEFCDSRCLLLDNRDFRIKVSTDCLLRFIVDMIGTREQFIEDVLVMPSKAFIIIRFSSTHFGNQVHELLSNNLPEEFSSLRGNFMLISDITYQLAHVKYAHLVKEMLGEFCLEMKPEGLTYLDDYITGDEERELLTYARQIFDDGGEHISKLKNRKAMHFGNVFDYKSNTIDTELDMVVDKSLPSICVPMLRRLVDEGLIGDMPDQCTVNFYDGHKGDHIPGHVDTHSMCTNWIATFNLGASVVMNFKRADQNWKTFLRNRSVMIMTDEARYAWTHGIAKVLFDLVPLAANDVGLDHECLGLAKRGQRISYTFRKTTPAGFRCNCGYPSLCDSQKKNADENVQSLEISSDKANELEAEHVHQVYRGIATHFSATRYGTWPPVVSFLNSLAPGSLVLDLGCGNGKYLGSVKHIHAIGTDRCEELLAICRQRQFDVFTDDILSIAGTLRAGIFDACICIAVVHHLATPERRKAAIANIVDLLAFNGKALVYVWAFEQRKDGKASKYLKEANAEQESTTEQQQPQQQQLISSKGFDLKVHKNRSDFEQQDVFVPWKIKQNNQEESVRHRYYHVFKQGELETLAQDVGAKVIDSFYDQGNWCVVLQKC